MKSCVQKMHRLSHTLNKSDYIIIENIKSFQR
jgi:hypothetical protein